MLPFRPVTGGRSPRLKPVGDCLVRAVAVALDADYKTVARYFSFLYQECGYGRTECANSSLRRRRRIADSSIPGILMTEVQRDALLGLGFRSASIPGSLDRQLDFAEVYDRVGDCIVTLRYAPDLHAVALVGGFYCDDSDSRFDDQGNPRLVQECWVQSPVLTIEAPLVHATAKRGTGRRSVEEMLHLEMLVGYDPRDTCKEWRE